MKRAFFIGGLLILIIGCGKQPKNDVKIEAVSVVTAKPFISDIVFSTTLLGTILPIKEADISPKMGGELVEILVKENTYVKKDQIVAKLDPTDAKLVLAQAEAGLKTAQAGLLQAEANYNNAKVEFERAKRLKETDAIADKAFDKAKTGFELASAQLEVAKAQVSQAEVGLATSKQQLEDTNITSPVDGIIASKIANEGERIRGMATILKVMNIAVVKLEVSASEDLITKIKKYKEVKVKLDAYPDKSFTGTINDISPTIDPLSRTFKVTIHIRNPHYILKPGMFARVVLELEKHKEVICIPQGAVFNRGLDNYIYIVEGNKAKLKQVKLGLQDLEKVEIVEGLLENEEVVIRGVENLQDGVLVKALNRKI